MNCATRRVYNDNKETGPVLRDLHILRQEWQTSPKQSPRRPSLGDQRWRGVAPLSKVLRVSTSKAFLTTTQETSLSPSVWPLMSRLKGPLYYVIVNNTANLGSRTHIDCNLADTAKSAVAKWTVQIISTLSGLFWCFRKVLTCLCSQWDCALFFDLAIVLLMRNSIIFKNNLRIHIFLNTNNSHGQFLKF